MQKRRPRRLSDSCRFPGFRPLPTVVGIYCEPENKVALGFVEGLNNKIRVLQRRAYGLRDEEYLRLKVLTTMLPPL